MWTSMRVMARFCGTRLTIDGMRRGLVALVLAFALPAFAGRDIGQDEALYLVSRGVIQSLERFIDDALARYPGRFLEAELEWDDGRYVYEIEIVTHSGKVLELEYDAVTGELLRIEKEL